MTFNNDTQKTIDELIVELKLSVQAGNQARAIELEQLILQRLANEVYEIQNKELQVYELMDRLNRSGVVEMVELPGSAQALPTQAATPPKVRSSRFSLTKELNSSSLPSAAHTDQEEGVVYPVWFGTNRKPATTGNGFTGERNEEITRGRVNVRIPKAHRFGETGTSFFKRLLRFNIKDDHLRIENIETKTQDIFFSEIQEAINASKKDGGESHALLFIHGFNVAFEEAAIRAAQIGYDLKVPGPTAFFSWPSRGSVTAYTFDEATIEASERAITQFLIEFATNCKADKIHVIAHSMGNRGLLRALQRIAANAETRGKVKFGQIFLAAPDVDRDLFLDLANIYPEYSERTTLYASKRDLPVHASFMLHNAPRAGYFEPYTVVSGIDTIAVPNFNVDLLGHSYFAQAEALLHDIYDLMRTNQAPGKRQRIEALIEGELSFWRLIR